MHACEGEGGYFDSASDLISSGQALLSVIVGVFHRWCQQRGIAEHEEGRSDRDVTYMHVFNDIRRAQLHVCLVHSGADDCINRYTKAFLTSLDSSATSMAQTETEALYAVFQFLV